MAPGNRGLLFLPVYAVSGGYSRRLWMTDIILDHILADLVDRNIVRVHDRLSRTCNPARTMHVGMVGQLLSELFDQIVQARRSGQVVIGNVVEDLGEILTSRRIPG